jgi:hypothetical protein
LDRGQPFQFTIGTGQVIKGWDDGMMRMSVGQGITNSHTFWGLFSSDSLRRSFIAYGWNVGMRRRSMCTGTL